MLPLIPPGAEAKVEPLLAPPRVGDIVVRVRSSGTIVHRVVRRYRSQPAEDMVVVTKGDNALRLDPPSDAGDIVGIVRIIYKDRGDETACVKALPRLSGLWIARLSRLPGMLASVLPRGIPYEERRKPRRTVSWLILSLFQRIVRRAIYFAAGHFSRHVRGSREEVAAGWSHHGKTASR